MTNEVGAEDLTDEVESENSKYTCLKYPLPEISDGGYVLIKGDRDIFIITDATSEEGTKLTTIPESKEFRDGNNDQRSNTQRFVENIVQPTLKGASKGAAKGAAESIFSEIFGCITG